MVDKEKQKKAKQSYFEKRKALANLIICACGCGTELLDVDNYGRNRIYISGHNSQKYKGKDSSKSAATKRWAKKNPEVIKDKKRNYYRKRKIKGMAHFGSKCNTCGIEYTGKNASIFEFHHTNPEEKEIGVSRILANFTWDKVILEMDKCVLLCANCHNQFHGGEW